MANDVLCELVKKYALDQSTQGTTTVETILYNAVGDYISYLLNIGNVPQKFLDEIETDLKEEALEIYRKITYGALSHQDFQKKTKSKRQRSS